MSFESSKRRQDLKEDDDVFQTHICKHGNIAMEGTNKVCIDCGIMLNGALTYEKEWRYYGNNDSKHSSDPNRCSIRKADDKSIFKDVDKLGFGDKVVSTANDIYQRVTNHHIYRGNTRKGIIFACIYHAYNINQTPKSCEQLIDIFEIDRKTALKGLKFVNLNLPKDFPVVRSNVQTEQLIREIMNKFYATPIHVEEALHMYIFVKNKSSLLNRSRPQSVASGLVRYYIMNKNPEITMEYFKSRISLSEITINRIAKEIKNIIDKYGYLNSPQESFVWKSTTEETVF